MSNGKVSVIVPVYNVEKYVAKCIESILAQTYTDIELLIVNDGSTDGSYEICKNYALKDSRIKLFTQDNKGLSASRNRMLKEATGDYVLFVDSDDWVLPYLIERLIVLISEKDADIAACGYIKAKTDSIESVPRHNWRISTYTGKEFADDMTRLFGCRSFAWGRLIRKSLADSLSFPEGRIFEDTYAMPKFALNSCKSVVYTKEPLYIYRIRKDSISHMHFTLKRTDELDGYICLTRYGIEFDSKRVFRNGAVFFILVYIRTALTISLRGEDRKRFFAKYRQYQRIYLPMVLMHKYSYNELIFKPLEPIY